MRSCPQGPAAAPGSARLAPSALAAIAVPRTFAPPPELRRLTGESQPPLGPRVASLPYNRPEGQAALTASDAAVPLVSLRQVPSRVTSNAVVAPCGVTSDAAIGSHLQRCCRSSVAASRAVVSHLQRCHVT